MPGSCILMPMERLLVVKPSSLGDIIHALLVVESYRQQRDGQVDVTWIARDVFAPFVKASTVVDRVLIYHRHAGLAGFRKLLGQIREQEIFDIALDMQGLARSAAMLWAAHAKRKLGRRDAREGAMFTYLEKPEMPPEGKQAHAVDILRKFLPLMGGEDTLPRELQFRPLPAAMPHNAQIHLPQDQPMVLLFPDSRRPEKEWPRFLELTQRLLAENDKLQVIWAGTGSLQPLQHWPKGRFINLMGKTAIEELPGLIQQASCVVANDSGPMHLAAAMNRPILALFGPTDPRRYGPYPPQSPGREVLSAPGGDLSALDEKRVAHKLLEILSNRKGSGFSS